MFFLRNMAPSCEAQRKILLNALLNLLVLPTVQKKQANTNKHHVNLMPNACIGFYIMDAKLPFLDFNNDLTLCMSLFGISKSLDNLIQQNRVVRAICQPMRR